MTNKNAKYILDGNVHEETEGETVLLAAVAAKQSARAGDGEGWGSKAKETTAPLIWPHQEFCNQCEAICFKNYMGKDIPKEKNWYLQGLQSQQGPCPAFLPSHKQLMGHGREVPKVIFQPLVLLI